VLPAGTVERLVRYPFPGNVVPGDPQLSRTRPHLRLLIRTQRLILRAAWCVQEGELIQVETNRRWVHGASLYRRTHHRPLTASFQPIFLPSA
jgi:hypothetical protein